MKKTIHRLSQGVFYTALMFWVIILCYCIGLLAGGCILSLVLSCYSVFEPLPNLVTEKMWLVYLVSGVPVGLCALVYVVRNIIMSRHLKKHNKQDNGNH
jgi:hypothetical protein